MFKIHVFSSKALKRQIPAFDPVVLTAPRRAMLSLSPDQEMNPLLRLHGSTLYSAVYSSMTSRGSHPHSYFIVCRCSPPFLLPGFNAPLVSVQPPLKYISLFIVSKQQGEKQNWKAWQSQLTTNILPCLCQKPGAPSDRKAAESGESTDSFRRQQWHESLQQGRADVCQAGRVGLH